MLTCSTLCIVWQYFSHMNHFFSSSQHTICCLRSPLISFHFNCCLSKRISQNSTVDLILISYHLKFIECNYSFLFSSFAFIPFFCVIVDASFSFCHSLEFVIYVWPHFVRSKSCKLIRWVDKKYSNPGQSSCYKQTEKWLLKIKSKRSTTTMKMDRRTCVSFLFSQLTARN